MTCAILFARHPTPGRVKTRLLAHLTPEMAAALYGAFLRDSVALLGAAAVQRRVVAAADGDDAVALRGFLEGCEAPGLEITVQVAGGLGRRMRAALAQAFAEGAERALILGSDSPSLPADTIDAALAALGGADVVLGPSTDGGYYLVGVTAAAFEAATPALFEGIDWSTGTVLAQSVAALPSDLRLALLPPWYDVDHAHEAAFLRDHLEALARAGQPAAPHSLRLLRGLELPPPS